MFRLANSLEGCSTRAEGYELRDREERRNGMTREQMMKRTLSPSELLNNAQWLGIGGSDEEIASIKALVEREEANSLK